MKMCKSKQYIVTSLLSIVTIFCSCDKSDALWTDKDRKVFIDTCLVEAKTSMGDSAGTLYCKCVLQNIEKLYPVKTDIENIKVVELEAATEFCMPKSPIILKAWNDTEKVAFMQNCLVQANNSLTEIQSQTYCSCMLDKISTLHPDMTYAQYLGLEDLKPLMDECKMTLPQPLQGWNEVETQELFDNCLKKLEEDYGEETQKICNCATEKVKQKVANLADWKVLTASEQQVLIDNCIE